MLRHEAALASGKLNRGSPGGQPTYWKSLCLGANGAEEKNQKTTRHFMFERDWTIVRVSGR